MKFGVREICDVVLRAKSAMKVGNRIFYKNEPVIYFDTLKTSSVEGQSTTVYAQGGRGNARLIAWEGERTITFTMEDALISPAGFSILSGAGLIKATEDKPIIIHKKERTEKVSIKYRSMGDGQGNTTQYKIVKILLKEKPYFGKNRIKGTSGGSSNIFLADPKEDFVYIMRLNEDGEVDSEPYIASEFETSIREVNGLWEISLPDKEFLHIAGSDFEQGANDALIFKRENDLDDFYEGCSVLVDYYTEQKKEAFQINITPDKFGGNFYLEASTLFKSTNGVDMPAEFIIPNCKIQSNFTFTMASSGDPSTFTFTMDAFPDYTRWDKTKKVFAAIQVIEQDQIAKDLERLGTSHLYKNDNDCEPYLTYMREQADLFEDNELEDNLIYNSIDTNGQIFNGKGFKINTRLSNGSLIYIDSDDSTNYNQYITTGFIPYKANQIIEISGFNYDEPESGSYSCEGIYYYKNDYAIAPGSQGNCFVLSQSDNSSTYSYGDSFIMPPIDTILEDNEKANNIAYIRVCFHNSKANELSVNIY